MSDYFNEAGEPLMDGAAMRYEMYLDSTYEPEPDYFLNNGVYRDEDYFYDHPDECEHGDCSYLNSAHADSGEVMCDLCEQIVATWERGEDGWCYRI